MHANLGVSLNVLHMIWNGSINEFMEKKSNRINGNFGCLHFSDPSLYIISLPTPHAILSMRMGTSQYPHIWEHNWIYFLVFIVLKSLETNTALTDSEA